MVQQKKLFTIDQAVEFVLGPESDSEMSDTEDEDDDDQAKDKLEEDEDSNNKAENDDQTTDENVNEGQNKISDSPEEEHIQTKKKCKTSIQMEKERTSSFDTSFKGGKVQFTTT